MFKLDLQPLEVEVDVDTLSRRPWRPMAMGCQLYMYITVHVRSHLIA